MLSKKSLEISSTGPASGADVSTKSSGKFDIDEEAEAKLNCDQFVDAAKQHEHAWCTMLAQHSKWLHFRASLSSASGMDLLNSLYKTQLVPKI